MMLRGSPVADLEARIGGSGGVSRTNYLFTSESVSEGHPDKVCDRISDEIVDLVYREAAKTGEDPWNVRIACETLATTNRVVIAGEVRLRGGVVGDDGGAPGAGGLEQQGHRDAGAVFAGRAVPEHRGRLVVRRGRDEAGDLREGIRTVLQHADVQLLERRQAARDGGELVVGLDPAAFERLAGH